MKFSFRKLFHSNKNPNLVVILGTQHPDPDILTLLSQKENMIVREALTTRGVLQNLSGAQLVILGDLITHENISPELLKSALDNSGIPVVSQTDFIKEPEEWLGRAQLSAAKQVYFLPARQINLFNWSGGVGKTTLALSICKQFVKRTGLPAALLELGLGGSALQGRISEDLPEFFSIATNKSDPALWNGVSLYPMDGRSFDVLWSENPQGIRDFITTIWQKHTLVVVDGFPGHPLFSELMQLLPGMFNLVVSSPRDDSLFQARRLLHEVSTPTHLILNMSKSFSDRAETELSVVLPYNETWAQSFNPRLADPILELVYPGWKGKKSIF